MGRWVKPKRREERHRVERLVRLMPQLQLRLAALHVDFTASLLEMRANQIRSEANRLSLQAQAQRRSIKPEWRSW